MSGDGWMSAVQLHWSGNQVHLIDGNVHSFEGTLKTHYTVTRYAENKPKNLIMCEGMCHSINRADQCQGEILTNVPS